MTRTIKEFYGVITCGETKVKVVASNYTKFVNEINKKSKSLTTLFGEECKVGEFFVQECEYTMTDEEFIKIAKPKPGVAKPYTTIAALEKEYKVERARKEK